MLSAVKLSMGTLVYAVICTTATWAAKDKIEHWSFRPIVRPALSSIQQPGILHGPLDHFVQAQIESV